ncbi:hypothetical protein V0M98_39390 (plasmid) [Pseudomonas silesiensis]|uniref:hypothetical protein n=1 Tax=Pseudomonas silesiensis TaxID=1853130 RepID=UPI0030CEBDD5
MKKAPKGNVYDIGTGRPAAPRKAANEDNPRTGGGDEGGSIEPGNAGRNAASVFFRHFLVMVLMWLRGPLRLIMGLIAVPTVIALPIVAFGLDASPEKTKIILALVAASFGSFCIRWLYDSLVMWISPEPLFLNS